MKHGHLKRSFIQAPGIKGVKCFVQRDMQRMTYGWIGFGKAPVKTQLCQSPLQQHSVNNIQVEFPKLQLAKGLAASSESRAQGPIVHSAPRLFMSIIN